MTSVTLGVFMYFILISAWVTSCACAESEIDVAETGDKCGDDPISKFVSTSMHSCSIVLDHISGPGTSGIPLILTWFTASVIIFLIASYGITHFPRNAKLVNKFGGPKPLPFFGNCGVFMGNPEDLAKRVARLSKKYGRCFRFWIFHTPYICITDAKSAAKVLSSSIHIHKGRDYKMFEWFLGTGLVTSHADEWKKDRKLLNPAFNFQRFDGFLASFNKHGRVLIDILAQKFPEGASQEMNLHKIVSLCTIDSISEAALGHKSAYQHDPNVKLVEQFQVALESFRLRILKPWLVWPIIWDIFGMGRKEPDCIDYFKTELGQIIESRRRARLIEDDEVTKPFIDFMLDCRTEEQIIYHVVTTFVAGFDTTASTINSTLYLLSQHPDVEAKVYKELIEIVGTDPDRDLTLLDVAEMKYLEMCIKESLRLLPAAPIFFRAPKEDVKLDDGRVIPPGTQVLFCTYELHRDPEVFPNPEKFDPERFLPEACAGRSIYAYMPFSAGPRSCIGQKYAMMQVKVILCHILRQFRVSSSKRLENVEVIFGMILEIKEDLPLLLTKREVDE